MTISIEQFVRREVIYCVGELISTLAAKAEYSEELMQVMAREECMTPAMEAGWVHVGNGDFANVLTGEEFSSRWKVANADAWRELCDREGIDAYQEDALEHWIVTYYMASKLKEKGELVLHDFLGLTIWGRTCSGQMIEYDGVIQEIYNEAVNS